MWYFIMIMCAIMMFLLALILYRFHTIDKIQKDCNKKVDEIKNKFWVIEEENAKLRTFKYLVENLITGMRTDEEVRSKIKELLFSTNNNSIS